MKDDFVFEYLSNDQNLIIEKKDESDKALPKDNSQFINGLPDWDLEPPFEIVRRKEL